MKTTHTRIKKVGKPTYGKPIPTKFTLEDTQFLNEAANATNLPISVLVRKAVRLLKVQKQNFRSYGFIIDIAA